MFLKLENQPANNIAITDDSGEKLTYSQLIHLSKTDYFSFIKSRCLVYILADNSIDSYLAYYSCINLGAVPLLLSHTIDNQLLKDLLVKYPPQYLWLPEKRCAEFDFEIVAKYRHFCIIKTPYDTSKLHEDLSMLLPTSGSTGSPKLVRHSYKNLEFSAKSVADFFCIDNTHSAIVFLPIYYTMGLSVINSHLFSGAKVVLTNRSLTDRGFWDMMKNEGVTTFTGVPYSFEILDKIRFTRMNLPELKIITQGGGKLRTDLFTKFADWASDNNIKFIPTYGQTEGTARMAYLESLKVLDKVGSIGKAIPGGYLGVIDEEGIEIEETEAQGEMIYRGDNVTLGYANTIEDLQKEDENRGELKTGDYVTRDRDGYYFIIGRKKRFLKIFGLRIGLDEIEQLVKSTFLFECICSGNDELLIIHIEEIEKKDEVLKFISEKTQLFHQNIEVRFLSEVNRNEAGKIIYKI